MFAPYRKILSTPGALSFSSAGVLARLPMSMVTISIVMLISAVYGEYGLAGGVAAAFTVAQAVCGPQLAKLVDRFGQAKVMRPALMLATVGLSGLAFAAAEEAHPGFLYGFAILAGATVGSIGSMVRARWNKALDDPRDLHTAYSLESALDEFVFVVGPVAATFLATEINPEAGLIVAIVAALSGGFWFLSQRATEPTATGRPPAEHRGSVMASGGMLAIAFVFICMGTIFGASDVSTVGFTEEEGMKSFAGVVLACCAFGSLISGLLYGARQFTTPLWKRFVVGMVLLAVGVSLFVFVHDVWILAGVMFVVGFAIAPTIIAGNALVQQLVPPTRLTEGLTWVGTAIGVGFSLASWIAGKVIDAAGAHSGYYVVLGAAGAALVVGLISAPVLRRSTAGAATLDEPSDAVVTDADPADAVVADAPVTP